MQNSARLCSTTHLLATLAILPLLVSHCGETTLLRGDTLLLLQGGAQGAGRDLGELVVAVRSWVSSRVRRQSSATYVKTPRHVALIVVEVYGQVGEEKDDGEQDIRKRPVRHVATITQALPRFEFQPPTELVSCDVIVAGLSHVL